jgi:hypothetical protein
MKRSIWLGYSIAPFTGPLLYGIIILFIPRIEDTCDESSAITWLASLISFALMSYISCLIIGGPLIYILKKINKFSFLWVVIPGSILYSIFIYITLFVILGGKITGNEFTVISYTLLAGAGLGVVVTTIFCYLAGITRRSI